MFFIYFSLACTYLIEEFLKSSENDELSNVSDENLTEDRIDTAEIEPAEEPTAEPSQPVSEPQATEPAEEPTTEPSQPTSEPSDTADSSPCNEDQICELTISNPTLFGCDSIEPQEIVFSNSGVGSLFMYHKSVYSGCCPTFAPTATADLNTSTILVEYSFTDDMCECLCEGISVRYTLSDIPAGTYQLSALTETVQVTVE
jgi:hypothetical protein